MSDALRIDKTIRINGQTFTIDEYNESDYPFTRADVPSIINNLNTTTASIMDHPFRLGPAFQSQALESCVVFQLSLRPTHSAFPGTRYQQCEARFMTTISEVDKELRMVGFFLAISKNARVFRL